MDGLAIVIVAIAILVGGFRALHTVGSVRNAGDIEGLDAEEFAELTTTGHWEGPRNASVVMVVYSDYACGFCGTLHETLKILKRRYPQHLAVITKHFVEPSYAPSFKVSLAAECAADQGRFVEYRDAAFRGVRFLDYSDGWRALAESVGMPDLPGLERCVERRKYAPRLEQQYAEGKGLGLSVTPSTFVNGHLILGAVPLEELDAFIAAQFPERARRH